MKAAKSEDMNGYITCVTCKKKDHWKKMEGGHFISRRHTATKILEEVIHPQCSYCNHFLKGNYAPYALYMVDMYGREFVDNLLIMKDTPRKFYRDEIAEIIKDFKSRLKELEADAIP